VTDVPDLVDHPLLGPYAGSAVADRTIESTGDGRIQVVTGPFGPWADNSVRVLAQSNFPIPRWSAAVVGGRRGRTKIAV
jgi:hypothetical protein